jgi:hypothetical protein
MLGRAINYTLGWWSRCIIAKLWSAAPATRERHPCRTRTHRTEVPHLRRFVGGDLGLVDDGVPLPTLVAKHGVLRHREIRIVDKSA